MSNLENLLAAARAGSSEALGQLLETCRPYLLLLAQKELAVDLQAKGSISDLLQDTFAEASAGFPRFTGRTEAELRAWLGRILSHNAINFANRFRHTGKRELARELSLDDSRVHDALAEQMLSDSSSPSGKALRHEEAEALERALKRLPEDYRQVIVLHHRENRPFDEIARLLGRSEAAVRKLWARALQRWRQELESHYGPP